MTAARTPESERRGMRNGARHPLAFLPFLARRRGVSWRMSS
jgi:hypothetical protein